MTGFLVNLLSPVFSSLGVSQADLTSYIEKLIGYVIAIFALLVVMIVVMVVAHKAKKGFRHVIRWQAAIAFIAIVAVRAHLHKSKTVHFLHHCVPGIHFQIFLFP